MSAYECWGGANLRAPVRAHLPTGVVMHRGCMFHVFMRCSAKFKGVLLLSKIQLRRFLAPVAYAPERNYNQTMLNRLCEKQMCAQTRTRSNRWHFGDRCNDEFDWLQSFILNPRVDRTMDPPPFTSVVHCSQYSFSKSISVHWNMLLSHVVFVHADVWCWI